MIIAKSVQFESTGLLSFQSSLLDLWSEHTVKAPTIQILAITRNGHLTKMKEIRFIHLFEVNVRLRNLMKRMQEFEINRNSTFSGESSRYRYVWDPEEAAAFTNNLSFSGLSFWL